MKVFLGGGFSSGWGIGGVVEKDRGMNLSMKKLCLFFTLYLFAFAQPIFASEPVSPMAESTPSSNLTIELSLSELPRVHLTPISPFYFLKILWENIRWYIKRSPEGKANLALELAEERLSEAVKVSEGRNLSLVERLFKERETLLKRAREQFEHLAGDEAQREEIRKSILWQLVLGREVLAKIKATLSDEDTPRVDNLSAWRDLWVAKLEEGLGPPRADFSESTESATERMTPIHRGLPPEATPEARKAGRASIWESLSSFLFGPRRTLLSPLAAPEED